MGYRSLLVIAAALGAATDWVLFVMLHGSGCNPIACQCVGFTAGALVMDGVLVCSVSPVWGPEMRRMLLPTGCRLLLVGALALFLGVGTLVSLAESGACPEMVAAAVAAGVAVTANLVGLHLIALPRRGVEKDMLRSWQFFGIGIVAYGVLLRLAFAGAVNLLPEEAYYWCYSQRPALGYLDHPPMVAWMIWLGTHLIGPTELGVRLPALLCWVATAYFAARFAADISGRKAVIGTLVLASAIPVFLGVGMLMTPDAPMFACWAGSLFFLHRALAMQKRWAWLGAGICLGLGMLSKYTIALLAPATLAFILLDRQSRQWLLRPQPYLALAAAALLFAPVVVWNASNHWASFAFQGTDRWTNSTGRFGTHVLIGSAALLLTPLGLVAAVWALLPPRWKGLPVAEEGLCHARARLFMLCYTLVPLAVFAASSLRNRPRVHWTGPVWLAVLPALGLALSPQMRSRRAFRFWSGGILACMLLYGALLSFIVAGAPGLPIGRDLTLYSAWREFGDMVEVIEDRAGGGDGQPVVVGMHRHVIASELAFYDDDHDGMEEMTGPHLFGRKSLMWSYWRTVSEASGKTLLLVDFDESALEAKELERQFSSLGAIRKEAVRKEGRVVCYFYHRIGYGYEPRSKL